MSPLWSDGALAQAAWTNALKEGLVDGRELSSRTESIRMRVLPRRPIRRVEDSAHTVFAL